MPAVTVENPLVLPRITAAPDAVDRPVTSVVAAHHAIEGAGFEVWRPFPGVVDPHVADPFYLLDQLGPVDYAPNEAVGAPWHPHRGFETVTYVIDGAIEHHDSHGGGGTIGEGDTQWMTAGSGILHDEVPTEAQIRNGGRTHGVQLWVNLPAALKFSPPRYQAITGDDLSLLSTHDGGALIRLIAGDLDGHAGPGSTHTPITYAHASVSPGAQVVVPWNPTLQRPRLRAQRQRLRRHRAAPRRRTPARRVRRGRHPHRGRSGPAARGLPAARGPAARRVAHP